MLIKILLVEDEPPLASFVKKGFEHEGYVVAVAYDGRTGWSLYEQQPYDLVILDINLPYLNGVATGTAALDRYGQYTLNGVGNYDTNFSGQYRG